MRSYFKHNMSLGGILGEILSASFCRALPVLVLLIATTVLAQAADPVKLPRGRAFPKGPYLVKPDPRALDWKRSPKRTNGAANF